MSLCASEHSSAAATALRLALHLLAHFHVDFEELGDAAVETDGFALVQVGFAVGRVDAFGAAGFEESECALECVALN